MNNTILYTFACRLCDSEECEYISYYIPEDEPNPKEYFEAQTGERVCAYWKARIK